MKSITWKWKKIRLQGRQHPEKPEIFTRSHTDHTHTHTPAHTAQHSTQVWCCRNNRRRRVFPARAPIAFATRITTESLRVRALAAAKRALDQREKCAELWCCWAWSSTCRRNEWMSWRERWQDSPDHGGDSGLELNRANDLDGTLYYHFKCQKKLFLVFFFHLQIYKLGMYKYKCVSNLVPLAKLLGLFRKKMVHRKKKHLQKATFAHEFSTALNLIS